MSLDRKVDRIEKIALNTAWILRMRFKNKLGFMNKLI